MKRSTPKQATDAKPMSALQFIPCIDTTMTCESVCMTQRGLLVAVGTKVTFIERIARQATKVRMEDGSEEIVNPTCFTELR
jgi:hypothetical protein